VYGTRFIAYLSRFLLNFDPSANAWWVKRGLGGDDTWDVMAGSAGSGDQNGGSSTQSTSSKSSLESAFAEFAESVSFQYYPCATW